MSEGVYSKIRPSFAEREDILGSFSIKELIDEMVSRREHIRLYSVAENDAFIIKVAKMNDNYFTSRVDVGPAMILIIRD